MGGAFVAAGAGARDDASAFVVWSGGGVREREGWVSVPVEGALVVVCAWARARESPMTRREVTMRRMG